MTYKCYILLVLMLLLFTNCKRKVSDDPKECYRLWLKQDPTQKVELIHGWCWKSNLWYKEFRHEHEIYLEMRVSRKWRNRLIKNNDLIISKQEWIKPDDAPTWFNPPGEYLKWKLPKKYRNNPNYSGITFEDSTTGHVFFYEFTK